MAYLNRVELIGNLGADPEVRSFADGGKVATLRMATTKRWTNRETGERQERTDWHRVVLKGGAAEVAGEHLKEGASIYVEGELRTRKYTDKGGHDAFITEVVSRNFQFLDRKGGE